MQIVSSKVTRVPQSHSVKEPWFGTTSNLTSTITPLYQDNSFFKYDYLQAAFDRKINTVSKAYTKAKTEVETLRSHIHFTFICRKQLAAIYTRKKAKSDLIQSNTIRIQKAIRGYLTRKHLQNELILLQRKAVNIRIGGLTASNISFMFNLGKAPVAAAKRIQNSVRKYLFRCKMTKFHLYYQKLIQERAEKIFSVIRKHLRCYTGKLKKHHVIFLRYRSNRLHEIRRNLAIITVAKVYRQLKLSFKSLKHRISKYKRRLRNSALYVNPPQLGLSPSASSGKLSIAQGSAVENQEDIDLQQLPEDLSSTTSEHERKEREEYLKQLEILRKERIRTGKISYSVKPPTPQPSLIPLLYQKDILEDINAPLNFYNITRATASRISESRPQRFSPPLVKFKPPEPFVPFKSRRIEMKPIPLFKKETISFMRSKRDTETEQEVNIPEKPRAKSRMNTTLFDCTFSHRQKLKFRVLTSSIEPDRPHTTFKRRMNYSKKPPVPRPYSMANSKIVFNPNI